MKKNKMILYGAVVVLLISVGILGTIVLMNGTINTDGLSFTENPPLTNIQQNDNTPIDDSNKDLPTGMTAFITPTTTYMGGLVRGTVSADGSNFPIVIKATHTGIGESQTVYGTVGENGKCEITTNIDISGIWNFQATATDNGVKSNVAVLTVQGIMINLESGFYSKTIKDNLKIEVFSHYTNQNINIIANDPSVGVSIPLGTVKSNSGGYATLNYNFDSFSNGNYEIDAFVGSDKASSYGESRWLEIGR